MKHTKKTLLYLSLGLLILFGCNNNSNSSNSNKSTIKSSSNFNVSSSSQSDATSSISSSSNNVHVDEKLKDKTINVYLIGGQSNAVGYGMDTNNNLANSNSKFVTGFDNVLYYGAQERWSGEYPNSKFEPVKLGYGVDSSRSGAEIGIANALKDSDEMNAVIKCAWGATHLYPDSNYDISFNQGTWTSPTYLTNNNVDTSKNEMIGRMYTWFEETVTNGINLLKEQGYKPVIKGMWWMQGEAETFSYEMSSAYEELLRTFIFDIRKSVGNITGYDCSEMPFVFGLPKWNTNNSAAPTYLYSVRDAMTRIADDSNVINAASVDCMTLTQHDDWHFNAVGQKYLGERFIETLDSLNEAPSFKEKIYIEDDVKLLLDDAGMEVKANVINYNAENNYKYGFIFVKQQELLDNNISENFIDYFKNNEIEYYDVECGIVENKIDNNYRDVSIIGSINNIEYENINTHYTAIAYIKDVNNKYLYSSSDVESSVSYLASYALYNETKNLEKIKDYVNAGINYALNVSEENKYKDADLILEVEDEINIKYSQAKGSVNLNLNQNPNVAYYVKYSSSNENIVSVDEKGELFANNLGEVVITIECGDTTKTVNVKVDYDSENGVTLDGVVQEKEYLGEVITKSNQNVTLNMQGMVVDGDTYLSFEFIHGTWSPYSASWYLNDNIEFKLDNGRSRTVVFYNGEPTFSSNISRGVANTFEQGDKFITTVELCVEGTESQYSLKVGMNGKNIGWFGAIWDGSNYNHNVFITENGIQEKVYLNNGIILDGEFNEEIWSEQVRTNCINVNANGADVNIMGTLIEDGVIFGVTINHTTDPNHSFSNGAWYSFMNVEFHLNNQQTQFISTCNNHVSNNGMSSYCKTLDNGDNYVSTFEIFIPYNLVGLSENVVSVDFACNGWVETGWCWFFKNDVTWPSTHILTIDGIRAK